jgi:kynureninase
VDLAAAGADFAVGCGYKYLNGGPGAPAYLYIARRHQEAAALPLSGWLGHAQPFAFEDSYKPAQGIRKARVGTPPILSLAALEIGVDLVAEAGIAALREKSMREVQVFATLFEQEAGSFGFRMVTPPDPAGRGSQVSFAHDSAWPIVQALGARGVIGDFRAPDILRFGIASLYTRYVDLWDAVAQIGDVMAQRAWDRPEFHAPSDGAT